MSVERDREGNGPVALVTGVGRAAGIGAAIAQSLHENGWRVITSAFRPYDQRMPWGADDSAISAVEADLSDPEVPDWLLAEAQRLAGPVSALVLSHAESVDSDLLTTSVESFDRHFAVNARATWLLVRAFARQFRGTKGTGRIVALSSDHTAFNLPYGASKGAMDRIVLAAAEEFASLGITSNVINPGATDTGWMTPEIEADVRKCNCQPRLGQPGDCANLVRFLCSEQGQWVNGQLLHSDGGLRR